MQNSESKRLLYRASSLAFRSILAFRCYAEKQEAAPSAACSHHLTAYLESSTCTGIQNQWCCSCIITYSGCIPEASAEVFLQLARLLQDLQAAVCLATGVLGLLNISYMPLCSFHASLGPSESEVLHTFENALSLSLSRARRARASTLSRSTTLAPLTVVSSLDHVSNERFFLNISRLEHELMLLLCTASPAVRHQRHPPHPKLRLKKLRPNLHGGAQSPRSRGSLD